MDDENDLGRVVEEEDRRSVRIGVTIAILLVGGLIAAIWPAVNAARRAAQRQQRTNNLKQIGLALQNWCDTYRRLPPDVYRDEDGRPLSSWRFRIMPYIHCLMFDLDMEAAWDAPVNRYMATTCGHAYGVGLGDARSAPRNTKVMAVTGPGTAFEEGREHDLKDLPGDLILAVEVAGSGVHWMEPGDLSVDEITAETLKGLHGTGILVLFVDGTVRYVPEETPIEDFKRLLTIELASQYDRDMLLPQQ